MFHVLTETVAEEMTPTSRALTLFDVAALEVCTCCVHILYTVVCTVVRVVSMTARRVRYITVTG